MIVGGPHSWNPSEDFGLQDPEKLKDENFKLDTELLSRLVQTYGVKRVDCRKNMFAVATYSREL